ncbi:MAG: phytanoyl-CoA dioxygenase family protein [Candidatus Pacebacteria bacterium]|nr:phytanoyl-CoA dioxygenase family protein [Candidatus Paceibacterota bacterium]
MTNQPKIPAKSYGILLRNSVQTEIQTVAEQVRILGYGILDSGYSSTEIAELSDEFNQIQNQYHAEFGLDKLTKINEQNSIRAMVTRSDRYLQMALNPKLLAVIQELILGKFILNQQNGIINPPQQDYNQGSWHRDLPYQHFVSSRPLAINALFCLDDFTIDNGATFVLPASHKSEAFPSEEFMAANAKQIEARAGSFIVLDCMTYHSGGYNSTAKVRRGINHLYTIPFIKQQIRFADSMAEASLDSVAKDILGLNYLEPDTISRYLETRNKNSY